MRMLTGSTELAGYSFQFCRLNAWPVATGAVLMPVETAWMTGVSEYGGLLQQTSGREAIDIKLTGVDQIRAAVEN